MKKILVLSLVLVSLGSAVSFADDGEGLAVPRKGTSERAAYDAADAQRQKDDSNYVYHLQGLQVVDGTTYDDAMTVEVDFYSEEDGEYDYQVEVRQERGAWVAGKVTRVNN